MNQQCQCTHSTHRPTVVAGGRYVVGENPTYRRSGGGTMAQLGLADGQVVEVTDPVDVDGDVWVKALDDPSYYGVDPRHLTPAPDPAAPAVDDDLLRAVGAEILRFAAPALANVTTSYDTLGDQLISSPAGQRLRAAWTAERDAHWESVKQTNHTLFAKAKSLERERDEARAEEQRVSNLYVADRAAMEAEIERLRAAVPSLPDVGPVTRNASGSLGCADLHFSPATTADTHRELAAAHLAVAAFLDAEAVDHTHDDEVDERFIVGPQPTYMGHPITREYVSPGEVVAAYRVFVRDGIEYALTYREKDGSSLSIDTSCLIPLDIRQREVDEIARELKEAARGTFEPWGQVSPEERGHYRDAANRVIQALDAHRARNGQEAGQ